jgi:hypothetical protein
MAFLDNSGDIILDAVLTDTGRFRLAKGDGSFRIAKFAVGDDEINYELYNKDHASGSAYFDLEILQTPCLEAFTNNTSMLKHRLISIPRTNLLYLPVTKLNDKEAPQRADTGAHIVCVDKETEDTAAIVSSVKKPGTLFGENPKSGDFIRVDQGLDTTEIPPSFNLDSDLVETQYIIQIDNRFGNLVSKTGNRAKVSFIDDDNVASYYLSLGTDQEYVSENTERETATGSQVVTGPRGTILEFKIQSSIELNSSTYLFEKLGDLTTGGSTAPVLEGTNVDVYFIDAIVRVVGATTGFSLDIPVRFVKKK